MIKFYLKNNTSHKNIFVKTKKKYMNKEREFRLKSYIFSTLIQIIKIFMNINFNCLVLLKKMLLI